MGARLALLMLVPATTAVLYALGLPPVGLAALGWIALAPLAAASSTLGVGSACALGAITGIATAAAVSPWLPSLIGDYFLLPGPPGVAAAIGAWALAGGVPFAMIAAWHAWASRIGPVSPWLFGCAWCVAEFGRAEPLLANPWGLLAYSQASAPHAAQVADLVGSFGLGALLATASAAVAQLAMPSSRNTRAWRIAFGVVIVIGAVLAYGAVRLQQSFSSGSPIKVGLVQGATPRAARWKPETAAANLDRYLQLSGRLDGAAVVMWPELAIEAYPDLDAAVRRRVARVTKGSSILLAGSLGATSTQPGAWRTNTIFLFDGAEIRARYDKRQLVPFSETRSVLRWFGSERDAFVAGHSDDPLPSPSGAIGIAICSEALFPGLVRERVRRGAEWLVNPSNDEWFTSAAAARHQLAAVTLRAIETRRWIARPTTTGFSAIIDPHGNVVTETPLAVATTLSGAVYPAQVVTGYVRFGDWVVLAAVIALGWDAINRARRGAGPPLNSRHRRYAS